MGDAELPQTLQRSGAAGGTGAPREPGGNFGVSETTSNSPGGLLCPGGPEQIHPCGIVTLELRKSGMEVFGNELEL